jgi:hypothetical protein
LLEERVQTWRVGIFWRCNAFLLLATKDGGVTSFSKLLKTAKKPESVQFCSLRRMDLLTYLRIFIAAHQLQDPDEIANVLNYYVDDVEFKNLEDNLALLEPVEQEDIAEICTFYEEFADLEVENTNMTSVRLKIFFQTALSELQFLLLSSD